MLKLKVSRRSWFGWRRRTRNSMKRCESSRRSTPRFGTSWMIWRPPPPLPRGRLRLPHLQGRGRSRAPRATPSRLTATRSARRPRSPASESDRIANPRSGSFTFAPIHPIRVWWVTEFHSRLPREDVSSERLTQVCALLWFSKGRERWVSMEEVWSEGDKRQPLSKSLLPVLLRACLPGEEEGKPSTKTLTIFFPISTARSWSSDAYICR